jgi:Zn ribbon nucleic-acid-binding protein
MEAGEKNVGGEMNYVHREYGETDYKDMGDSLLLWPGEKPRTLDPWVEPGNPCPHCKHTDSISWTFNNATRCMVAECKYCGYYKERFEGEALPITEEMKKEDFGNRKDTVCQKCGKVFSQLVKKNHTMCGPCRFKLYQRKYQREYGRKLRLRAKSNIDMGSAVIPKTKSNRKEDNTNVGNVSTSGVGSGNPTSTERRTA